VVLVRSKLSFRFVGGGNLRLQVLQHFSISCGMVEDCYLMLALERA